MPASSWMAGAAAGLPPTGHVQQFRDYGVAQRGPSGAVVHPDVPGFSHLLVAVPATVHRGRGEWETGTRSEGGSYSILSFVRKCGQGMGGFVGGAVIGSFGYVAGSVFQSAEAIQGIK